MTIAERQAREAHDRENPWRKMNEQRRPGLICNLLLDDMAGHHDTEKRYVEIEPGKWWDIDGSGAGYGYVGYHVIHWRAAYVCMTREKRSLIKKQYDEWAGALR